MNYTEYTAENFLMDDAFLDWVINPSPEKSEYWNTFLQKHPEKKSEFERAKRLYDLLRVNNDFLSEKEKLEIKAKAKDQIQPHLKIDKKSNPKILWLKVAAVFLAFLAIVFTIYQSQNNLSSYSTVASGYGELKEIELPDGSLVTLNANSEFKYLKNLEKASIREVWLDGEAFFEVKHDEGKKFIIHTGKLDVEVLGTSFNINNRNNKTKVILNTGKVKIQLEDSKPQDAIYMVPGEMVEYNKNEHKVSKKLVDPEVYTLWKSNNLVFQDLSIAEIAQVLSDQYGYTIQIKDKKLAGRKFTGRFPSDNVDLVFNTLEKVLDMEVERVNEKEFNWYTNK